MIRWKVLIFSMPGDAASGFSERAEAGVVKNAIATAAEAIVEQRVRIFPGRDSTATPF